LVGLASFTGCIVAVDKLFLFYTCAFYKLMAVLDRRGWEPTLRYPNQLKRGAKQPKVLVQLPMFNETHVAARIIEYACKMEYPRDKCAASLRSSVAHSSRAKPDTRLSCTRFEVQVLDDSTDAETRAVVDKAIDYWRREGIVINAVRRTNRQGFKAGAMHEVRSRMGSARWLGWGWQWLFHICRSICIMLQRAARPAPPQIVSPDHPGAPVHPVWFSWAE